MNITTLTLGSRQLSTLRRVLAMHLDMHFDSMEDAPDADTLLDLQVLVDVCDKVDVEVLKEVRSFLADRR